MEIRRQARADKIKVRTGFNDGIVWALRLRPDPSTHVRDIQRYRDLLAQTVPVAVDLGHEPTLSLWDGDEVICVCDRCSARGYGEVVHDVQRRGLSDAEVAAYSEIVSHGDKPLHRVLGHPALIQTPDPRDDDAELTLLMQIDSEDTNGMYWGDCRRLYVWITAPDLAARRFDHATMLFDQ